MLHRSLPLDETSFKTCIYELYRVLRSINLKPKSNGFKHQLLSGCEILEAKVELRFTFQFTSLKLLLEKIE